MSSKQEWLVILPDYAGALAKRMEVRPAHLGHAKTCVEAGQVVMGGATLAEPVEEGKPINITGSAMLYAADTKEEVMQWVESDIYYKSDVWDKSKVQIIPFKCAFRTAM